MNILLTRPLSQVSPLQLLVSEAGYKPLIFPSLEIATLKATPQKNHYDVMIFISVNAVEQGLGVLKSLNHQACKIFAVGAVTAKKLVDYGFEVTGFPNKNASSEALLLMPMISKLRNQDVLIFRGRGGAQTLKASLSINNTVEYIEVYQRIQPLITSSHQSVLTRFLQTKLGIITITSIENLSSMLSMCEKINVSALQLIKTYPLAVLSTRIKIYADSIGFNKIEVAPQTNDAGLIQAIKRITQA